MTTIASNIGDVAFALQTAMGSPAAVSQWRLYPRNSTLEATPSVQSFEEMTALRLRSAAFLGELVIGGDVEMYVRPETIAPILYGVLGAQAIAGVANPYTHTMTPAASLPYFTFWRSLGNGLAEKFVDCIITKVVLHGESYMPLTVTLSVMGLAASYLTSAEATATPETINAFMHSDAAGALKVEGTALSCISQFDLTIDNGAQAVPGDGLAACDISIGQLSVEAQTTQLLSSFSLWNRLHYGAASPGNTDPHTSTPLELAGSPAGLDWLWTRVAATRTLEVKVPRVIVAPFGFQGSPSGDPLVQQVNYTAYQPAAGAAVTGIVLNSAAAIYAGV